MIPLMVCVFYLKEDFKSLTPQLALHKLLLLNLLIKGEDDLICNVPSQRLIFLTKHLLSIPSFNQAPASLQSELFSTLASILPPIKELYGDFWKDVVTLLTQYLNSVADASHIAPLHGALRLHACLVSLANGESNEDLEDELSKVKVSLDTSLLEILTHFDGKSCLVSNFAFTELNCHRNPFWPQSASRNYYRSSGTSSAESTVRQTRRNRGSLPPFVVRRPGSTRSSLWHLTSVTAIDTGASVNRGSPFQERCTSS
jgi:hypothetical protein